MPQTDSKIVSGVFKGTTVFYKRLTKNRTGGTIIEKMKCQAELVEAGLDTKHTAFDKLLMTSILRL